MIPPLLTLYFSGRVLLNNLRYDEAALGMLFSRLDETALLISIFAVSMIIFSATRIMDLIDLFWPIPGNDEIIAALTWLISIILAVVFYRVATITVPGRRISR